MNARHPDSKRMLVTSDSTENKQSATNREHYVGGARIMELFSSQLNPTSLAAPYGQTSPKVSMPKLSGVQTNFALLKIAEQVARAQAWDSWCKVAHPRFTNLYGIPGGVLTLKTLEHVSPKFSAWLEQPYDAIAKVAEDTQKEIKNG